MHTLIEQEQHYSAQNLNPLPIVLQRGEDCWLWDVNDKQYLDCSSALMVNNFGHCHPKIVKTAQEQVATLTMVSRLFYNDQLPGLLQHVCEPVNQKKGDEQKKWCLFRQQISIKHSREQR